MDIQEQFGLALQRLRRARGLSQEALADEAEIDRAYVGRLERGEANPTLLTIARIAAGLNVAVADLVRDMQATAGGGTKRKRRRRGSGGMARARPSSV